MEGVTNSELWRAVGVQLRGLRERQGFERPYHLYQLRREPAVNTITAIEEGHASTIDAVDTYCTVLGVTLPEVLRQIIGGPGTLPADADAIARAYVAMPDPEMRAAMRALARYGGPTPAPAHAPSPAGSDGPPQATGGTVKPARTRQRR